MLRTLLPTKSRKLHMETSQVQPHSKYRLSCFRNWIAIELTNIVHSLQVDIKWLETAGINMLLLYNPFPEFFCIRKYKAVFLAYVP